METDLCEQEDWVVVPTFSGENLSVWIAEIEELMSRFDVPIIQKVNFSHVYVTGSAREWVRMHIEEIYMMDWSEFVEALRVEFDTSPFVEEKAVDSLGEENGVIDTLHVEVEQQDCNSVHINFASPDGPILGITNKAKNAEIQGMVRVYNVVASPSRFVDVTPSKGINIAAPDRTIGQNISTSLYNMADKVEGYDYRDIDFSWEPGPFIQIPYRLHKSVIAASQCPNCETMPEDQLLVMYDSISAYVPLSFRQQQRIYPCEPNSVTSWANGFYVLQPSISVFMGCEYVDSSMIGFQYGGDGTATTKLQCLDEQWFKPRLGTNHSCSAFLDSNAVCTILPIIRNLQSATVGDFANLLLFKTASPAKEGLHVEMLVMFIRCFDPGIFWQVLGHKCVFDSQCLWVVAECLKNGVSLTWPGHRLSAMAFVWQDNIWHTDRVRTTSNTIWDISIGQFSDFPELNKSVWPWQPIGKCTLSSQFCVTSQNYLSRNCVILGHLCAYFRFIVSILDSLSANRGLIFIDSCKELKTRSAGIHYVQHRAVRIVELIICSYHRAVHCAGNMLLIDVKPLAIKLFDNAVWAALRASSKFMWSCTQFGHTLLWQLSSHHVGSSIIFTDLGLQVLVLVALITLTVARAEHVSDIHVLINFTAAMECSVGSLAWKFDCIVIVVRLANNMSMFSLSTTVLPFNMDVFSDSHMTEMSINWDSGIISTSWGCIQLNQPCPFALHHFAIDRTITGCTLGSDKVVQDFKAQVFPTLRIAKFTPSDSLLHTPVWTYIIEMINKVFELRSHTMGYCVSEEHVLGSEYGLSIFSDMLDSLSYVPQSQTVPVLLLPKLLPMLDGIPSYSFFNQFPGGVVFMLYPTRLSKGLQLFPRFSSTPICFDPGSAHEIAAVPFLAWGIRHWEFLLLKYYVCAIVCLPVYLVICDSGVGRWPRVSFGFGWVITIVAPNPHGLSANTFAVQDFPRVSEASKLPGKCYSSLIFEVTFGQALANGSVEKAFIIAETMNNTVCFHLSQGFSTMHNIIVLNMEGYMAVWVTLCFDPGILGSVFSATTHAEHLSWLPFPGSNFSLQSVVPMPILDWTCTKDIHIFYCQWVQCNGIFSGTIQCASKTPGTLERDRYLLIARRCSVLDDRVLRSSTNAVSTIRTLLVSWSAGFTPLQSAITTPPVTQCSLHPCTTQFLLIKWTAETNPMTTWCERTSFYNAYQAMVNLQAAKRTQPARPTDSLSRPAVQSEALLSQPSPTTMVSL